MGKHELIDLICTVLEKYPYVLRAELFGSQHREDADAKSDVDLIVHFDPLSRPKGWVFMRWSLPWKSGLGCLSIWFRNICCTTLCARALVPIGR